ncbi:MAG TPA: CehA/McbA family metallohydrolase [Polyangia bacterium]|nr:CehA/McbA family metallohydrolase [Polyangia bacterium]
MRRPLCLAAAALVCALAAAGCRRDGCVGGDDGVCVPPPPCAALAPPACVTPALGASRVGDDSKRVAGPKSLAARGDYVLENDRVRVVLDAPEHPHGLGPTGGAILDLSPLGSASGNDGDQTNTIYQAAGLLPRDAVHYESAEILDPGLPPADPHAYVAVVFRGHLEADTRVTVVTRYEVRPCEDGVRVRSDLYNGAPAPNTLYLTDGLFWGDNGPAPFVPAQGMGFVQPDLDLLHIDAAWRTWPFIAARGQAPPETAYALVSCDHTETAGFTSTTLSAAGVPLGVTQPGDGFHFERFVAAVPSDGTRPATAGVPAPSAAGLAPAVAEALRVRSAVHGDPPAVTVTGRMVANGAPVDSRAGRAASLLFYEPAFGPDPDDPTRRTPWNEAVPLGDGSFGVALPPNRAYRVQPYAFGLPAGPASSFAVTTADAGPFPIGDISITASSHLTVNVQSAPGVLASYAELVVIPVDDPGASGAPVPSLYSLFPGCAPMLGPPDGGSPACNRALTFNGRFDLLLPPGKFFVYGTRGPFATLDRAEVDLAPGQTVQVTLLVESLASSLLPEGVISGDFHVHGAASFDSSIPDLERVTSFLATGVDMIVATDHNVITTYATTLETLGATHTLAVIPGVEQTPNIPWYYVPGHEFPRTLGHFNFWPLVPDMLDTRNGAPWPELREPGQVMDDMDALFEHPEVSIRQLNHPYSAAKLGRDQGYARAIEYDPGQVIPDEPRSGANFAANALASRPGGSGHHRNVDWNVQEVMTGASRADWLRYRALWFSMLSQGLLRTGTANSDSHGLAVERIGYPRNLIWGGHDKTNLNVDKFDADVLAGHVEGTNGPVLDVTLDDGSGTRHRPDLDRTNPISVGAGAGLYVSVTAAPWIPVDEVRIFVNGNLVHREPVHQPNVWDPFSTQPFQYMHNQFFTLATLLPARGDAWVVVEAGLTQDTPGDADGDGLPDLPDTDLPGRPARLSDRRFDLQAIAPGVWPAAFTNPFLIDVDGGGWTAPIQP